MPKQYVSIKLEKDVYFELKRMKKLAELEKTRDITLSEFIADLIKERGRKQFRVPGITTKI